MGNRASKGNRLLAVSLAFVLSWLATPTTLMAESNSAWGQFLEGALKAAEGRAPSSAHGPSQPAGQSVHPKPAGGALSSPPGHALTLQEFLAAPLGAAMKGNCPFCGSATLWEKEDSQDPGGTIVTFPCGECGKPTAGFYVDEDGKWAEAPVSPGASGDVLQTGGIARLKCPKCQKTSWQLMPKGKGSMHECTECSALLFRADVDETGRVRSLPDYFEGVNPPSEKGISWCDIWLQELAAFHYNQAKAASGDQTWQSSAYTLQTGTGVCRDSATLLADWLWSKGYDARIVLGTVHSPDVPGGSGGHAWVVLVEKETGKEYLLETTADSKESIMKTPPLAITKTEYVPEYQVLPDGFLSRTTKGWTGDYKNGWVLTPHPLPGAVD